jgi:hypothetical protein
MGAWRGRGRRRSGVGLRRERVVVARVLCETGRTRPAAIGVRGRSVPLSEDEQRILHEIEQQFYATDPQFAKEVGSTTLYRHALRNMKWAALGFLAGVALLIYTLITTNFVVSFVCGFLVMLASALWFERNARALGKAGLQQVTSSMKASGVREYFGSTGRRMRERFRRGDQQ